MPNLNSFKSADPNLYRVTLGSVIKLKFLDWQNLLDFQAILAKYLIDKHGGQRSMVLLSKQRDIGKIKQINVI